MAEDEVNQGPDPEPLADVPKEILDGTDKPWPILGIEVRHNPEWDQEELVATTNMPAGRIIGYIQGYPVKNPTRHSITHKRTGQPDEFIQPCGPIGKSSHSCDPNATIRGLAMVLLKPVKEGEQITWDYRTTEAQFSAPFVCNCGADNCCRSEIKPLGNEERRGR